jgi:hypothetical protein
MAMDADAPPLVVGDPVSEMPNDGSDYADAEQDADND